MRGGKVLLAALDTNVNGRHVCYERRDDAVRVASATSTEHRVVAIVPCDRKCSAHRRWRVVGCTFAGAEEAIAPSIDTMRAAPPEQWERVYAQLAAKHRASAALDGTGLHGSSGSAVGGVTVHRGAWYWRMWYGVPRMTKGQLLAHHCATRQKWGLRANDVLANLSRSQAAYAATVKAASQSAAAAFVRACTSAGRMLDAERMRVAVLHEDFAVRVFGTGSKLRGALFPFSSLEVTHQADTCPVADAAFDDNRRILVVAPTRSWSELEALLAHELAHALFPPVWLPENHPPAFEIAKAEMLAVLRAQTEVRTKLLGGQHAYL